MANGNEPKATPTPEEAAKILKKIDGEAKKQFALHVGVIMQVHNVDLPTARARAYIEGREGMWDRLRPGMTLPQGAREQEPLLPNVVPEAEKKK